MHYLDYRNEFLDQLNKCRLLTEINNVLVTGEAFIIKLESLIADDKINIHIANKYIIETNELIIEKTLTFLN